MENNTRNEYELEVGENLSQSIIVIAVSSTLGWAFKTWINRYKEKQTRLKYEDDKRKLEFEETLKCMKNGGWFKHTLESTGQQVERKWHKENGKTIWEYRDVEGNSIEKNGVLLK